MSRQRNIRKFLLALFIAIIIPSGKSGPSGDEVTSRPSVPSAPPLNERSTRE
jgi:hypothetical protein